LDKTQFTISIVTNIVAAIIIWCWNRLTRRAKSLLVSGTIKARVRAILSSKATPVIASSVLLGFDLLVLLRFVIGHSTFTRVEILLACAFALISAYWTKQLITVLGFGITRQLRQAESRLATLEAATRTRRLTPEQREFLLQRLRGVPPGSFDLDLAGGGNEISEFANDLTNALKEAGWVLERNSLRLGGAGPRGTGLIVQDPNTPRAAVLQQTLNEIGFLTPGEVNTNRQPDSVTLYIGEKPLPSD